MLHEGTGFTPPLTAKKTKTQAGPCQVIQNHRQKRGRSAPSPRQSPRSTSNLEGRSQGCLFRMPARTRPSVEPSRRGFRAIVRPTPQVRLAPESVAPSVLLSAAACVLISAPTPAAKFEEQRFRWSFYGTLRQPLLAAEGSTPLSMGLTKNEGCGSIH